MCDPSLIKNPDPTNSAAGGYVDGKQVSKARAPDALLIHSRDEKGRPVGRGGETRKRKIDEIVSGITR